MFSLFKKTKLKKSVPILNDNKENYSVSVISPNPSDKNLTNDKIHVDITQNSSDKFVVNYNSNESSPRDLSSSSPPIHKTCLTHSTGIITSNQIGRNDLNRILTSGYLNGGKNMGYMKRPSSDHISSCTKSPQFHRPIGFSYNRTQTFVIPGTKKGMKALVTGQTKVRKIHCSTPQSVPSTADPQSTTEKEPIVLSRYSGGFVPDPTAPKKIESLDWPAPIAIQAVPELLKPHRSRSESHSNQNEMIDDNNNNNQQIVPQEFVDKNDIRHDDKLDKDINEMSKIKDSSGMAHALLEQLRLEEKILAKQLPLDPWKASRSPSAAIEPPQRCRFLSPTIASPSRRIHTHSSSTTAANHDLTLHSLPTRKPIQSENCDLDSTTNSSYSNDGDKSMDNRYTQTSHSAPVLMTNSKIYPYEELKVMSKKRFPADVDRDHLERHLSDSEFHFLFQMTRSDFYRLPEWRRVDLKKRFKLF